jgi:signal transduction histidine kinase
MDPRDLVHELRNFLQPLHYHTQALQALKTSNATFNQSVATLAERMQAVTEFMDKVTVLSQPLALSAGPCRAADLLASAWNRVEAPEKIVWTLKAPPDLPMAAWDGEWMIAAFVEVFRNALEAVSRRGEPAVRATVSQHKETLEILIEDNGPGFPPDLLPRLGETFVSNKTGAGTGIGLSLAKKIIESHGGTIAFSNGLDGGAGVKIVVPVKAV